MFRAVAIAALLAGGCKSESGADPAEVETAPQVQKGSAGGFSASLGAELGSGSAGSGSAGSAGSAGSGSAGSGSSAMSAAMAPPPPAPPDAAMAAMAAPADAAVAKASPPDAAMVAAAGSAGKPAAGGGSATPVPTPPPAKPPAVKPVMTPELAAIKLTMQPNWDRDTIEAGSISLFEKNTNATFKFTYGYDDPKAPADREAYKKFLGDSGILAVRLDRQSGASWYLEGNDASGKAAFRILVTYGGKRLVCGGSLYKDSPFGDLRDAVLIQAKQICESIQL